MNGLWIRVVANIGSRKVVWRAVDVLGISVEAAVGHLVMLWGAVAQNTKHGDVSDVPDRALEAWAGWNGEAGAFASFIREHHVTDGRINEWDEYAGTLEERRERDRERKRKARASAGIPADVREVSGRTRTRTRTERKETSSSPPPVDVASDGSASEAIGILGPLYPALIAHVGSSSAADPDLTQRTFRDECQAALDGLHQIRVTPEQLRAAVSEFVSDNQPAKLKLFRGYLRNATKPPRDPPANGNGRQHPAGIGAGGKTYLNARRALGITDDD